MRIKTLCLAILGSTALAATAAQANNFKDVDAAIDYRQAAFEVMAHNFADIGAMVKGKKAFDNDLLLMRAKNVAALAMLPQEGFIAGEDNKDSDALPTIWKNQADFSAKFTAMQANTQTLLQAAQSGDESQIKQAFAATGKSCKACHDLYKKD
ncbi:c-type cytochrome [Shewanella sp. YIC-542]|uniref:c-type cytochrome n=1 Tax=Shewanella mytili TaxID=3377111 RepID=UPI00398E4D89